MNKLIARDTYLKQALLFRDTDLIKVITGVRRCGKSSLLALIRQQLEAEKVPGRAFVSLNLESKAVSIENSDELYTYCKKQASSQGKTYFFIDEPQQLPSWEKAINALRIDIDCDIYITGSNAFLLSSELSTLLSGRYVEIRMLPLSFSEFLDFNGLSFSSNRAVTLDYQGQPVLFDDVFAHYLTYGGFPELASVETTQEMHSVYTSGMYETVVTKDVLNRERIHGRSQVTSAETLSNIVTYLADNIGNLLSTKTIANVLTDAGDKTSHVTAMSYIRALDEAYLFYRAGRYDVHGKELLRTMPKQYIVDLGLRSFLEGYRNTDSGRVFENAVYLQLLYQGYTVHVGKLYTKEIDFIAIKNAQRLYIQVTDDLSDEKTRERELAPLQSIPDNFPKFVVTRNRTLLTDVEGIRILSAQQFFTQSWNVGV